MTTTLIEPLTQPTLIPSLLSAPFDRLRDAVLELEAEGVRVLHFDVMDGHFVDNITMGPLVLYSLQGKVKSHFDVHLMVDNPEKQLEWFDLPCVRSISIHAEASKNLSYDLSDIRRRGIQAGVAINPDTSPKEIEPYFHLLDQILVMTVYPGVGGQEMIVETLDSIRYLAQRKREGKHAFVIQVDGGVHPETLLDLLNAGAEEFISGSAVFGHPQPTEAYQQLKSMLTSSRSS